MDLSTTSIATITKPYWQKGPPLAYRKYFCPGRSRLKFWSKMLGLGSCQVVWEKIRGDFPPPSGNWFKAHFFAAATIVVERWGPKWSQKRILSDSPIGVWLLLLLWIGVPVIIFSLIW